MKIQCDNTFALSEGKTRALNLTLPESACCRKVFSLNQEDLDLYRVSFPMA
jgi:hypothetical protein